MRASTLMRPGRKTGRWFRQSISLLLALALMTCSVIIPGGGWAQAEDELSGKTEQPILLVSGDDIIPSGIYTAANVKNEKSYTLDELQGMTDLVESNYYSTINNSGTKRIHLGDGITVEGLLEQSGFSLSTDSEISMMGDDEGVSFNGSKPLLGRYYYPHIGTGSESDSVVVDAILAWANSREDQSGGSPVLPQDTNDIEEEDLLTLMVGQQNINDVNNSLYWTGVRNLIVGDVLTNTLITIAGEEFTRGEILMMERADRSYTYTKSGDITATEYVRGIPLAVLLDGYDNDYVVNFTTADNWDVEASGMTVGDLISGNYMLAYEKGDSESGPKDGIYDTKKDDASVYGYFRLYGDAVSPAKMITSITVNSPEYVDYTDSSYKHINNGGLSGDAPYNIDAITGATLTVEGPGVESTTPIRIYDLEATANANIYRGLYTDVREGNPAEFSYEGVKVLSIIDGLVNSNVEIVDEDVQIIFKNRWRQNVGYISYEQLVDAETPVILAYGTGTADGATVAPFVYDNDLGSVAGLDNEDGCVKLVYNKNEFPFLSLHDQFVSVAYIYVEQGGEPPGYKHSEASDDAYKNVANTEQLLTFTGTALGREVNYTVAELEAMVEYGPDDLPVAGGLGYRDEYGLSNTTYWYVNEYEGVKLWDFLTQKMGLNAGTYANDNNTLVSFAAWDNYQTTAQFSMAQLADPDRFYFYEKSPLDIGTTRPTKAQLATPEYQPDNTVGEWDTDSNGYPVKKGYPVMLAYGVNGYPYVRDSSLPGYAGGLGNDGGPMRVIFGKTDGMNRSNPEDPTNYAYFYNNGSNQLQRAQEIYVGDDKRYSTHMENPEYTAMADSTALTVEVVQGGTTTTKTYTLAQLESLLYGAGISKGDMEKEGRQEKAYYAHKVFNEALLEDLFEGVNLWYLLSEDVGMQGVLGNVSLYSGSSETSALDLTLTDLQSEGFNSLRNTDGLGMMVAFAKNGYPLVLDKNAAGYVSTDTVTGKTIENSDGPLMFVSAQTEAQKDAGTPGAAVTNLTKIVINLEADIYAHTGDYAAYGENEVAFSGAVKDGAVTLSVSDLEKLQKYMVTGSYTVGGVSQTYRGIDLKRLLFSSSVGASALLDQVTVSNGDSGSKTVTVADMNGAAKPIILAYGIGKTGADPIGKPLVPDESSPGYDGEYLNSGGPLRLIIDGSAEDDCIENVTAIAVTAATLTGWTHSAGAFAAYKNKTLSVSGSNSARSLHMTVEQIEALSSTYKIFDQYKMGNFLYFEGVDLLKLLRDHVGFSNDLQSSNITVYSKDGYHIDFSATDLTNGVNGKPIILAYGQGISADDGLPLVDGNDTNDIRDGFDSDIGNAFGPLRLVVHDNTGWCSKWVTAIVVGTGSVEPPPTHDFVLTNGSEVSNYDISDIKAITTGSGGEATASYLYTSSSVLKTDYVKGIFLADLLAHAGISGAQAKVTINCTDGFESKQPSYREISLADISSQGYFLAYDAGESAGAMTDILDEDKNGVEATVRIYRNYDDGSSWMNRLTNIKGITVTGAGSADPEYTFTVYPGSGQAGELPTASVRDVAIDAGGGMWVGTNNGGAWYKPAAGEEFTINTLTSEGYVLQSNLVYAIAIDSGGGVWFTQSKTYNPGQAHLNKGAAYLKDGAITYYNTDVPGTIPDNYVQEVRIDGGGNVWFGSFGGLTRYNPGTATWTSWDQNYADGEGDHFPATSVDNLICDGQGGVWLGFYPTGAGTETDPFVGGFAHMTADGDITPYQYTADYDSTLATSLLAQVWVRDIAVDANGGAWVVASGSYPEMANVGGTVWYVDNNGTATRFTGDQLLGAGSLTGNVEIRMVNVDANGGLWLGTSGDGLFYIADPGTTAPLTITAQYSGANAAWPDNVYFNNIYAMDIIDGVMYLGSDGGVMTAALADIAAPPEPEVIETFTIAGLDAGEISYYVGGSGHEHTFKGLPAGAGQVLSSYPYNGDTHYVKGALLKDLLADAGAGDNIKVTITTSDGYTKASYQNIPYADIVAKNYFVAYDVGENTETLGKVADEDGNGVTASYRIYRNLDDGTAGLKDNRIKGVVGITVSDAGGGGVDPGDYDLTINGSGVNQITHYSISELKNDLTTRTASYFWLNSFGSTGTDEFEGVYLEDLLDEVGLKSSAESVTVTASDGYHRSFNLDGSALGVYWTDIQGNQIMLAWERNGSSCPLQLVVGQTASDHVNKPMWVNDVETITVKTEKTESGSGSAGGYEPPQSQQPAGGLMITPTIQGDTAQTTISGEDMEAALEALKEAAADPLAPLNLEIDAVSDSPDEVRESEVTLAAEAVKALAREGNVTLTIKTDQGIIELPPAVLQFLAQGGSDEIQIVMGEAADPDLNTAIQDVIGQRPILDVMIFKGGQELTDLDGNQLKIMIPYTMSGQESPDRLLIYYIDDQGQGIAVVVSLYDQQNQSMVFETTHFSLYAVGYNGISFNDIDGSWARENIEFLAARGIVNGRAEGVFSPDGNVTRAEFLTMLANSVSGLNAADSANAGFNDVPAGAWYADTVNWAVGKGIVSGYGDGRFGPDDLITREQVAVMMDNFITAMGVELQSEQEPSSYTDQAQISAWARPAIARMQQFGIMTGRNAGMFAPLANTTRAEAATLIKGYVESKLGL